MKISKVIWGSRFLRSFNKIIKKDSELRNDFKKFFAGFCAKPMDKKYNLHKLKGRLEGAYSIKIKYDLRLIAEIDKEEIILVDIGTHDQVY